VLANHRRTLFYSAGLLLVTVGVFVGVGRHPASEAPVTTFAPMGNLDLRVLDLAQQIRNEFLTEFARVLNVLGAGVFTIPLRAAVAVWLAVVKRWRALTVWALTWVSVELLIVATKAFYHRGRPPGPLVETSGFSFPSGHAAAVAATAVALVLVVMPAGSRRRKWEWIAGGFAFFMALSRVYLSAHWFSDVVAGVLLGTGVALAWAAVVTEVRDLLTARSGGVRTPEEARELDAPPTPM
jgi:membrane-associated PAP2 superfamily phosphatase